MSVQNQTQQASTSHTRTVIATPGSHGEHWKLWTKRVLQNSCSKVYHSPAVQPSLLGRLVSWLQGYCKLVRVNAGAGTKVDLVTDSAVLSTSTKPEIPRITNLGFLEGCIGFRQNTWLRL